MQAEIVMIGTELLLGEIVDTNATLLAKMLRDIGVNLHYKTTVGDNETRITAVLNLALERAGVVITSGGLGPTMDDITRQAVANATGRPLVYSTELEAQIRARFRSFGRNDISENNKRQAYIPAGAIPLENLVGTAPCFLSEDVGGRGFIISLPGVPRELEHMMTTTVLPILVERMGGAQIIKARILRTCAVGESNVDQAIGDLMSETNPTVGLAAHIGQTDVRITAKAATEAEADALLAPMEAKLRERLGVAIYGVAQETVGEVTGRLLAAQGLTLGVVDTLTHGGMVQDIEAADFAAQVGPHVHSLTVEQALEAVGLKLDLTLSDRDGHTLAKYVAEAIAPADGMGLAVIGPLSDGQTFIGVHGPGNIRLTRAGRHFEKSEYMRRWLIVQSLDWVRRSIIGELQSPVDW